MRIVLFCHSLVSDWNHGNAHFLRGICSELRRRGHEVVAYEPADAWSLRNLLEEVHPRGLARVRADLRTRYPHLRTVRYAPDGLDLERALDGADLVLVHEWNDPDLVRRIGEHRRLHGGYRLLFHDSHHRSVSAPDELERYPLELYDGVLAFGDAVREIYLRRGWGRRVWTWHEAADVRVFRPLRRAPESDLVWIGNWGDEERTEELRRFLLDPVRELRLDAAVHGVRYPDRAIHAVREAGADYRGWIANYRTPEAYARYRVTVHVPRRAYLEELPGVPTIRPFEALACGIPLVSARWTDPAGLFRPGKDFLVARSPAEMRRHLHALLHDRGLRRSLARHGRRTVLENHTCAHRVDELLGIYAGLEGRKLELEATGTGPSAAGDVAGAAAGATHARPEGRQPT